MSRTVAAFTPGAEDGANDNNTSGIRRRHDEQSDGEDHSPHHRRRRPAQPPARSITSAGTLRPPAGTSRPPSPPPVDTSRPPSPPPVDTSRPPSPPPAGTSRLPSPPLAGTSRPPSPPPAGTSRPPSPPSVGTWRPPSPPPAGTSRPPSPPPAGTWRPPSPPPAGTSRPPARTSRPPARTSRPPARTSRPPARTSRPPSPPPAGMSRLPAYTSRPPSPPARQPYLNRQLQRQAEVELRHRRQRRPPPPYPTSGVGGTIEISVENNKKLLEWELSSLEADDLRSHAWYHGLRVDRVEAERLLRQYVAEEHGVDTTTATKTTTTATTAAASTVADNNGGTKAPVPEPVEGDEPDSDGLEDVSSNESDFALDDDVVASDSYAVRDTVLFNFDRSSLDGSKRPQRQPRHFYCFLVRDSGNLRPPGRFVLSCLRVDEYDNKDDQKNMNGRNIGNERKRKQFLRKQYQRRLQRQQRRPVLHFVINEIILQPETVYERSQYTFGDTLPTAASINNNSQFHGQRKYQPGFDSVPDLIRYYVGGADDNAVLSYGGGNDLTGNSTPSTEVRIRYPCNRHCPLMVPTTSKKVVGKTSISRTGELSRLARQNSRGLNSTTKLNDQFLATIPFKPVDSSSSFSLTHHRWDSSSPSQRSTDFKHISSSFRSTPRRTPTATVTSATISSATSSTEGSNRTDPPPPYPDHLRPSTSSSCSQSKIASCHSMSDFLPSSSSSSSQSDITLSHLLTSSPFSSRPSSTCRQSNTFLRPYTLSTDPFFNTTLDPPPSTSVSSYLDMSSYDSPQSTNKRRCSRVIDMDAEIAAMLSTVGDINDDEIDRTFPSFVQSSFSQINVDYDFRNSNNEMNVEQQQKTQKVFNNSQHSNIDKFESQKNEQKKEDTLELQWKIQQNFQSNKEDVKQLRKVDMISTTKNENTEEWRNILESRFDTLNPQNQERILRLKKQVMKFRLEKRRQRYLHQTLVQSEIPSLDILTKNIKYFSSIISDDESEKLLEILTMQGQKLIDFIVQNPTEILKSVSGDAHLRPLHDVLTEIIINKWASVYQNIPINMKEKILLEREIQQVRNQPNSMLKDGKDLDKNNESIVNELCGQMGAYGSLPVVNNFFQYNKNNSRTLDKETNNCSVEINSVENKSVCDYENINSCIRFRYKYSSVYFPHHNSNQDNKKQHNINDNSNIQHSMNDTYLSSNTSASTEYENIASHKANYAEGIDYENIGIDNKKYHHQNRHTFLYNNKKVDFSVTAALLAVHMAIIGDPEDASGITSVAGTGKLAALLCHADGKVTVLPYRFNHLKKENQLEGPILNMCPLQLLGQQGPAGRRARLDLIERFACLQYLVSITVIVTPCLLLIGVDNNDSTSSIHKHSNWSLEDEYEYRRRRFYYRCAGADSSGDDSDDDDYDLTDDSAFYTGHSIPPKEEWAAEKRYWLDRLARHRAAALDKWIRTAADTKQAMGDVFGYRALMSALCSDRIQSLQDAWASLRRLYTTTAVVFESRLKPEFLGRRDKNATTTAGDSVNNLSSEDENNLDLLLQLPPNATIPDATALAVYYEHVYNGDDKENINSNITSSINDSYSKGDKNRSSSLYTSPLLMFSSSPNCSLSSGLLGLEATDFGLQALHVLCVHYSEWVQQNVEKNESNVSSTRSPMLQLDRFRSNLRALLRQYGDCDDNDDSNEYDDKNISSSNQEDYQSSNDVPFQGNSKYDFTYERYYEEKVEEFGRDTGDGECDDCGDDDDDDDATVICCSNKSYITAVDNVTSTTMSANMDTTTTKEELIPKLSRNHRQHRRVQVQDRYCKWIKTLSTSCLGPAPLNSVFRTELHVRLFWPPAFLDNNKVNKSVVENKFTIPAYALGTTYTAIAETVLNNAGKGLENLHFKPSPLELNQIITAQLDRVTQDMYFRYKIMDKFLDKASINSTSAAKAFYADITMRNKHQ